MAYLTVAAVVARLEAAVTGLSGWDPAPLPVGLVARSSRAVLHKGAFVMALQTDVPTPTGGGRRATLAEGAWVISRIRVEWGYQLTVQDYAAAVAEAYAAEAALLVALLAVSRADLTLVPERMTRAVGSVSDSERTQLLGTIDLLAHHTIALA